MATPRPSAPTSAATAPPPEDASPQPETAPAPEPWTPERALVWNRYYDRYLVGGLLLLVFLVSAHKVTNSTLWPLLKAGEVMIQKQTILNTDEFSYTAAGKRWVNIPWIYEIFSYLMYSVGAKMFPNDASLGQQIGATTLVALNAIVRTLSVFLLLRLKKPGPGLWWFCIVALFAMGMFWGPRVAGFEFTPGGIARQPLILPETWGILLLAAEIVLMEKAYRRGSPRALLGMIPLFLFWANVDESFVFGLLVLLAGVIGFAVQRAPLSTPNDAGGRPTLALSAAALLGSFGVCLANPSFFHAFPTAFEPFLESVSIVFGPYVGTVPSEQHAFFGRETFTTLERFDGASVPWNRMYYYIAIVAVGISSFAINWRRFDLGRFAIYLLGAVVWAAMSRLSAEFATIFVFAVGLNGQEWYQAKFGTEGRTSAGWSAWSVGGRAVTILIMFLAIAKTLTGYGYDTTTYPRVLPPFGFGVYPSEFDFEASEFLKTAPITGKVLNLDARQGDALIWKAYPEQKVFIDRRKGVYDPETRADLIAFRKGFQLDETDKTVVNVKNDPQKWRPILDKYGASVIMLDPSELPLVYQGLAVDSEHFIPIYYDGRTAIFGRKDASPEDLKFFESVKLDANELVYNRKQTLLPPDRAPTPMTFLDRITRNRALVPPQPHVFASTYWLSPAEGSPDGLPDAAHCIMAIREARIALYHNPDEYAAYLHLYQAYAGLFANEIRVFRNKGVEPPAEFLQFRYRQRMTALNFAIQTTPPPRDSTERQEKGKLHGSLAALYRENRILDLEHDQLAEMRDLYAPEPLDPAEEKRLIALADAIGRFRDRLQQLTTEQNLDPQQRANMANSAGFLGIAIHELEDAEGQGVNADAVLANLVDLYCRTGQPEKANDKISMKAGDDPALSDGPGTATHRQGLVSSLLGYYDTAILFWRDRSLMIIRQAQSQRALAFGHQMVVGQALPAVNGVLELLGVPNAPGLLEIQSNWEWELGLIMLEAGQPKDAGTHFANAIQINPKTAMRPLLEDYLKKLDVPLPFLALPVEPSPVSPGVGPLK